GVVEQAEPQRPPALRVDPDAVGAAGIAGLVENPVGLVQVEPDLLLVTRLPEVRGEDGRNVADPFLRHAVVDLADQLLLVDGVVEGLPNGRVLESGVTVAERLPIAGPRADVERDRAGPPFRR